MKTEAQVNQMVFAYK